MESAIENNVKLSRFEMEVEGQIIFANYQKLVNTIRILHVEAPQALRGTGAAGRFMHALMVSLRADGLKAAPICSYAVAWLMRHPEFNDILSDK